MPKRKFIIKIFGFLLQITIKKFLTQSPYHLPHLTTSPIKNIYLSGPFDSFPLLECRSASTTESLLCSSSWLMLLLTNSIGSVLTSSVDRAEGDGVKLSLSVVDPKLPPPLPFVVKLIVSFKLLLLLFGLLLFVLNVLLLLPGIRENTVIRHDTTDCIHKILTIRCLYIQTISIFNMWRNIIHVLNVGREISCSNLWHVIDDI